MKKPHHHVLACALLLPLALALSLQEDDLVFDDVGEDSANEAAAPTVNYHPSSRLDRHEHTLEPSSRDGKRHRFERLWGVPDTVVPVGHIFKMKIPRQAFSGNVDFYEVHETIDRNRLPRWLYWDDAASTLSGVPSKKDVGSHHLTVKAISKHGDIAKDQFVVQVIPEKLEELKHKDGKMHCDDDEEQTILTVLLDARLDRLSPRARVDAIENLAGFLGMHKSAFSMHSQTKHDNMLSVLFGGHGNVPYHREMFLTTIQWQVGCDGHLWRHQVELIRQLREQAKDGTLAEVLQLPVILWRVKTDSSSFLRNRREVGSGDDNSDDYDGYDDDYDGDYEDGGEDREDDNEDPQVQPTYVPPDFSGARGNTVSEHPHRHHHGEETIDWNGEEIDEEEIVPRLRQTELESAAVNRTSNTTPTVTPSIESPRSEVTEESTEKTKHVEVESVTVLPTVPTDITTTPLPITTQPFSTAASQTSAYDRVETEIAAGINNVTTEEPTEQTTITTREWTTTSTTTPVVANVTNATAPYTTSTTTTTTTTTTMVPSVSETNATSTATTTVIPSTTELRTTTSTTSYTTNATTTSTSISTTAAPTTTSPTTTTVRVTTESIEYGVVNFPPRRDRILKKIPVTAGKLLNYAIPANTFSDLEDGDTRKLKLNLYWQGVPLKPTHWLQFNRLKQEVYGLPLENDISTWNYELVATDSEGANVTDHLDIHVQQHKLSRSVNHEFSIYLRIEKRNEFPTDVDWEFKVIRGLAKLYGDEDTRHITVRNIDFNTPDHEQQAIFTWTNDSLPRSSECPREHINKLLRVLIDNDGDPSTSLRSALSPEIRVKRVVYQGIGQCEDMKRPEMPRVSTEEPKANYPPVPRNQVDHVNATVGQLLVFKVPEDTFFDAEDGSSRNMKMSLLTIDRVPIPPHEWLQFDSKNQEFYGVPMRNDVGRKEYQLVVTDKEGASATDGLVVVVNPAPHMAHTVEFSMTLDIPYDSFAHSALQKRNFIEKLRDLYGDKDTSAISLYSISNGSTVITWHNRTLPTSYCAHDEVNRLRSVLVKSDNDRRSVTDEVLDVMGLNFPVKQITVIPMGICLGELTGVHSPDSHVPPVDDSTSVGAFHDDYLFTFVLPAIIISIMLIGAGIIACVLYKRRRSGKMSVSEKDEERQSFRSKGIPVIFQDELDEKPDPGNKSPVILKEEKPPLPPPEYQKAEDGADVPMLPKENSEEPYQPPPPFATSRDTNRQNRPKPTPTYRKPPPYVPP
ncbi:Dystroglycan [Harpegnathos saltator]|uniref:Dystroglycan 1 n=1 Tax=Harpegnathos saltator TaxID=610380 RepID=E2BC96_HARSA|nr:Dystroglycan [Harpegnathos saltator]